MFNPKDINNLEINFIAKLLILLGFMHKETITYKSFGVRAYTD